MRKLKSALSLMANGNISELIGELRKRLNSTSHYFGLRRDLKIPFDNPDAKIPVTVRELNSEDLKYLLDAQFRKEDPRLAEYQQAIVNSGLKTAYVATNEHDIAAYMQFLIKPDQNELIQKHFKGIFPLLKDDEGLLEGAFMNPEFRGQRIMPAAMARIAEKATELGLKSAITFVDVTNIPSLKGCHRAGFSPYVLRVDRWYMFKRSVTYRPVEKQLLDEYEQNIGISRETVNA